MKVILTRDVPRVGQDGEIVTVADGYARNYLFTRQLAVPARGAAIRDHQRRLDRERQQSEKALEGAKVSAEKLEGLSVQILVRTAPKSTRMFGSVTEADAAEALEKSTGIAVDKRKISLIDPIKTLGSYPLTVKLHTDVTASFVLDIVNQDVLDAREREQAVAEEKAAQEAARQSAEAAAAETSAS